ncbi:high mobility group protein [Salix suchowensis]|nr:high mobility group protein [Salix suchowensis]
MQVMRRRPKRMEIWVQLREDFRKEFQEQNPDVKSMREVGKACGEKWKTMTYEEKVKYYDIATEKRAEFDRAMSEYIRREESGEDEDLDPISQIVVHLHLIHNIVDHFHLKQWLKICIFFPC